MSNTALVVKGYVCTGEAPSIPTCCHSDMSPLRNWLIIVGVATLPMGLRFRVRGRDRVSVGMETCRKGDMSEWRDWTHAQYGDARDIGGGRKVINLFQIGIKIVWGGQDQTEQFGHGSQSCPWSMILSYSRGHPWATAPTLLLKDNFSFLQ